MQFFSVVQTLERIVAKKFLFGYKSSYIVVANLLLQMLQSFVAFIFFFDATVLQVACTDATNGVEAALAGVGRWPGAS